MRDILEIYLDIFIGLDWKCCRICELDCLFKYSFVSTKYHSNQILWKEREKKNSLSREGDGACFNELYFVPL